MIVFFVFCLLAGFGNVYFMLWQIFMCAHKPLALRYASRAGEPSVPRPAAVSCVTSHKVLTVAVLTHAVSVFLACRSLRFDIYINAICLGFIGIEVFIVSTALCCLVRRRATLSPDDCHTTTHMSSVCRASLRC